MSLEVTKMRKVELIDHNSNKKRASQNLVYQEDRLTVQLLYIKRKANLVLSTKTEDISPQKN